VETPIYSATSGFWLRATQSWRKVAFGLSAVLAVAGAGMVATARFPVAVDRDAPPPRILIAEEEIPYGAEGHAKALEAVRRFAQSSVAISLSEAGQPTRTLSFAALGAEVDKARLFSLLGQAKDPSSVMHRTARAARQPIVLPIPVALRYKEAFGALLRLKDEVDRPPIDARFDLETRRLLPEQSGAWLDVAETLARIDAASVRGERAVKAAFDTQPARLAQAQMGGVSFGEVLGWFETRYATDKKHEARTFNLRLAASKLDGHVILAGETFDFNDVVGPRDEANGYKVAPVIAQGELVDGVGGGTCQIAGTLHGAAFFSGLDIVERHPHTRPSFYIKMGLDATVVYPAITLRLRNGFGHPVVLHETVRGGVVRAEVLGPTRSRTVTLVRKIDDVVPFAEVERRDPKLPRGTKVLSQRGIPGFRIHRYRIVRQGAFAVRERYSDTYPPTNQIVRVGTGDGLDVEGKEDDPHPEYVADEYLVLLQGSDLKGLGKVDRGAAPSPGSGEMVEVREAGRTGERGWTERAGFSHYEGGRRPNDAEADLAGAGESAPDRSEDRSERARRTASADRGVAADRRPKARRRRP
jgi:vancomycin resistance protein YoaR